MLKQATLAAVLFTAFIGFIVVLATMPETVKIALVVGGLLLVGVSIIVFFFSIFYAIAGDMIEHYESSKKAVKEPNNILARIKKSYWRK